MSHGQKKAQSQPDNYDGLNGLQAVYVASTSVQDAVVATKNERLPPPVAGQCYESLKPSLAVRTHVAQSQSRRSVATTDEHYSDLRHVDGSLYDLEETDMDSPSLSPRPNRVNTMFQEPVIYIYIYI